MRLKNLMVFALATTFISTSLVSASADSAKPGQSMTHMKTGAGLASTLEAAGVVLYVQGGATSSVIGDSIGAAAGQYVFHIPITSNKSGVQHLGSNIVFFNTANNLQLQLRNPVIELSTGVVRALVPQAGDQVLDILTITNASTLKAKITRDRKANLRTTAYVGATLSLAPGIAASISSILGLPANSLPDAAAFGSADVTLYGKDKRK
ncbi:MAG: hypothetical protein RLZZ302_152 [Actinomycetota bacterium]|jgi:hypothetical protein